MSDFINRHGKRILVDESEESSPEKSKSMPATKVESKGPVKINKTQAVPKQFFGKKFWFWVSAILLLILIVLLVGADSVKRGYEQKTSLMKKSISELSKTLPSVDTKPASVVKGLEDGLSASRDCMNQKLSFAVGWYGPAQKALVNCRETALHYQNLKNNLSNFYDATKYLESVSGLLSSATVLPADGEFAAIGEYLERWAAAANNSGEITPPKSLESLHETLKKRINLVKDSWDSLSQANNSQDAQAFKKAEAALPESYIELRKSGDEIKLRLNNLQDEIFKELTFL